MVQRTRYYDPETETFLPGARCHIEQYEILKRCSEAGGDVSEWQAYRKAHPDEEIWLCGADLEDVVLKSPAYEAWRKDHEPREMTHDERWTLGLFGLGGLTISDDGGLEELDEFLESVATCSVSLAT